MEVPEVLVNQLEPWQMPSFSHRLILVLKYVSSVRS